VAHPSPNPGSVTHRRLLSACLLIGLILCVPAIATSAFHSSLRPVDVGGVPYPAAKELTSTLVSSSNVSWVYPSDALSEMQNSSALAVDLFSHLGLNSRLVSSSSGTQDQPGLISRSPPELSPGLASSYSVESFLNENGTQIDLYYFQSNATAGFLQVADVRLNSESLNNHNDPPYSLSALAIGQSIGIPMGMTSSVSFINSSDRTTVVFSSLLDGLDMIACNLAAFTFENSSGNLLRVQVRPFLDTASFDATIPPEAVGNLAVEAVEANLYNTNDVWIADEVTGIRLTVEPYIAPIFPGNRTDPDHGHARLAYEYRTDLRNRDGGDYSIFVLIDCEAGKVTSVGRTPLSPPVDDMFVIKGWWVLGLSLSAVLICFVALVFVTPEFTWLVLASYPILAYVRLRGAKALDNFNRGRIMGFISAKPGSTFTDIQDALRIMNGSLAYHLSVLEKLELISSSKEGRSRRYVPIGVILPKGENQLIGQTESKIMEQLDTKGPLSNAAIAITLGMSRQRTHYNLKLLRRRGLVDKIGKQWKTRPQELERSGPSIGD